MPHSSTLKRLAHDTTFSQDRDMWLFKENLQMFGSRTPSCFFVTYSFIFYRLPFSIKSWKIRNTMKMKPNIMMGPIFKIIGMTLGIYCRSLHLNYPQYRPITCYCNCINEEIHFWLLDCIRIYSQYREFKYWDESSCNLMTSNNNCSYNYYMKYISNNFNPLFTL